MEKQGVKTLFFHFLGNSVSLKNLPKDNQVQWLQIQKIHV